MMQVNNIFYSVQGEGVHAGVPTVFVRLQGCNLRCAWCDTVGAQDPEGGEAMTPVQIANNVKALAKLRRVWVCITGGEPLLQAGLEELVGALKRVGGYQIEVETNGSIEPPKWFRTVDSWVADIKCPSSGMSGASTYRGWFALRRVDQVKFVVADSQDLNFVRELVTCWSCIPEVLISPVIPPSPDALIADVMYAQRGWLQEVAEFCKERGVRFSLQIHKLVWGNKDGV